MSLLLVLNPGVVFQADASPGRARVDRSGGSLTQRAADGLGLPVQPAKGSVWYAEATVSHRAGVAGVTWTSDHEPAAVYLREVTGTTLGPWRELDVEPVNPSEPGNGKGGTDPYVIAGAQRVQVAAVSDARLSAGLNVYASPEVSTTTTTVGVTKAAAAGVAYAWSNPQILARSEWGADESLVREPYTYAQVTGAMIHHTAGSNTYAEADVPAILRSIQAYHVNDRGWNDMAYNFLIDKFGRAWEGRGGGVDKAVQGGHAWSVTNARTTGVSLIGNYETVTPPAGMLDTAERVIAWKFALHGVDPYGSTYGSGGQDGGSTFLNAISGHRDENATDCPGQYVYSQMATIRSKVAGYLPLYQKGTVSPFSDVATTSSAYKEIKWMYDSGISTGWDDGTFRPSQQVDRDAMAAFFYRFRDLPTFTAPAASPFTDIDSSTQFYKEMAWMKATGISTGWDDGTYRPWATTYRDAMAAFVYRTAGSPAFAPPAASPFGDVTPSTQFYKEMTWLAAAGIATGTADGNFHPAEPVTREMMAVFMYRLAHPTH